MLKDKSLEVLSMPRCQGRDLASLKMALVDDSVFALQQNAFAFVRPISGFCQGLHMSNQSKSIAHFETFARMIVVMSS